MSGCTSLRVAVVVVLVAIEAVVRVVAERLVGNAGEGAGPVLAVADVVVAVGDGAVLAVLDGTGDRLGLQTAQVVVGVPGGPMAELFDPGALAGAGGVVLSAVDDRVGGTAINEKVEPVQGVVGVLVLDRVRVVDAL